MGHHVQVIFVVLVETGFCHVGQAGLKLLASSDPPASALRKCWDCRHEPLCLVYRNLLNSLFGTRHSGSANFVFLVETVFNCVGQAGLELLTSSDPPTSSSQSARITGVNHHTQTKINCILK